ncbi:hypothetical protein COL154_003987 [Colletotrichum chrysophilum]|uniref:uncharacterized protein n=1 Tax=Colletotrichum chrysophilum TaxID=1836956 RepID=UPI002300DF4D|nr:uncharacterized protein COL26b_010814 [Colletotrichum chrysophilum]KAJ0343939.1 hypothetical protein KNSL1_009823 [Colletotrichum chrysophilum]KAJ0366075.1 hypothetical protein COL154_003987 [Colletotrichum chrysophilum]KAJ0368531.1 hypothetical protein COL26b_010814 [Colletotrichum chrysophilum]
MASHKPTYAQALAHAKVLHDDFQTELAAFRQNLSSHWDSCKDILETFEDGDDLIGGREADRVEVKKGRYTDDESGTGQGNGEQPWVFEEYDPGASGKAGPEEWWEDSEKKEANLIDLS